MEPNQNPAPPNNAAYPTHEVPVTPPAAPQDSLPQTPKSKPPKEGNGINIPAVLAVVMFIAAVGLGILLVVYVNKYNVAQTNVNQQRNDAANIAKQEQKQIDQKDFAEQLKQPFRTYQAPAVLGAIKMDFPKDWNVYAVESEKATTQLDVFMYPGVVRAPGSTTEPYAFRIKLEKQLYTETLRKYQQDIQKGVITAKPVTVSGITGTRLDGQIERDRTGSIILLPIRDKTLYLWTESVNYLPDYNGIIQRMSISP